MLSEEALDKVVERLVNRIEQGNEYVLGKIGSKIDEIGKLQPTQAMQLSQMIKYGGDYDKIVKKLAEITKLNKKDIEKIFEEVAKQDQKFAEKFYKYRNKKFIPFDENNQLKKQVDALAKITQDKYTEIARTKALGFSVRNKKGVQIFKGLKETYNETIDRAILSVAQGKTTFQDEMYRILKEIGISGIKTLDFNGRTMRLDSAIRMHLKDAIRQLHNELDDEFGKEFNADGKEISVHLNPAPDHELAQGRQFSNEEFEKLQSDGTAKTYDGIEVNMHRELKDGSSTDYFRQISQYNCYHKTFSIILGVSTPVYSDEELQKIIDDNDKGFDFEGKHYTMYEGTQLQRKLETEIRKNKDLQILGRTSGNEKLATESQIKINQLTKEYNKLSQKSGLEKYTDRMRVSGYRPIKVVETPIKPSVERIEKPKVEQSITPMQENAGKSFDFEEYKDKFSKKGIELSDDLKTMDGELLEKNIQHLDYLSNKYDITSNQSLTINMKANPRHIGTTWYRDSKMGFNHKYFDNKQTLIDVEMEGQKSQWHNKIKDEDLDIYTATHEFGHLIENDYTRRYLKEHKGINTSIKQDGMTRQEKKLREAMDKEIRDDMFDYIRKQEKLNITEIKDKYFSGYGKSHPHYEWFAETFTQLELGEQNLLTEAMQDWLERNAIWK